MSIEYLRKKLLAKKARADERYKFYEMKHVAPDFNISTPPDLLHFHSSLGWCTKAVDALSDRLQFREMANDDFGMNDIFVANNGDILFSSAIQSALIVSCCFVPIGNTSDGVKLDVVDGRNATGIIDTSTNLLTEGYAVLDIDPETKKATLEAHYLPFKTVYYSGSEIVHIDEHASRFPMLVPVIYRPDAVRPFGHSRISRACMSLMDSASRTIKRSEISAEFYSYPQKYATGLSTDAEQIENWKASMSAMITFTKDEDGDHPVLGQFQQQSMSPHAEQLKMFASAFAGETGLTLDDLGFPTDNPSSAESIKAAHENLRLMARKAQADFGTAFRNVGYMACCMRDSMDYPRSMFMKARPLWEPVFEPDMSALSLIGDGAIKINQAVPGFFNDSTLRDLTGIEPAAEEVGATIDDVNEVLETEVE